MQISISKTDLASLMSLIDKCTTMVQDKSTTLREYNAARRLKLIKKKIVRINKLNEL